MLGDYSYRGQISNHVTSISAHAFHNHRHLASVLCNRLDKCDKRPYKCIVIRRRHRRTSALGLTQIFSRCTLIWAEGEIRNRSKKGDGVFLRHDDDRQAQYYSATPATRNARRCRQLGPPRSSTNEC